MFDYHDNINNQSNTVDLNAVQRAYVSNKAQQKMSLQIIQSSTAVAKGIAVLPQSSNAGNVVNAHMKASIALNTNIENYCSVMQNNLILFNIKDYDTVRMYNLTFDQTNEAYSSCTQMAVNTNSMSQEVIAQVGQIASATSAGLNLLALLIVFAIIACVFFLTVGGTIVGGAYIGFLLFGIALLITGAVFMILFAVSKKQQGLWCGFSPGIEHSASCRGFRPYGAPTYFDSSDQAQEKCLNDPTCTAMDWTWQPEGGPRAGTAQFYQGNGDYLECTEIVFSGSDQGNNLISFRNPVYINASLGPEESPSNDIPGDVLLDVNSGRLYYRKPPVKEGETPRWVTPSSLYDEAYVDNVFDGAVDSAGEPVTLDTGNRVFIYITQAQADSIQLPDPKTEGLVHSPYPAEPWNTDSRVVGGDGNWPIGANANENNPQRYEAKEGDYFLVVYPMGPTDKNFAGEDDSVEQYNFSQQYHLYAARIGREEGIEEGVENILGTDPNTEHLLNEIPGAGPEPVIQLYQSTYFKYTTRNWWYLWAGIAGILCGIGLLWQSSRQNKKEKEAAAGQKEGEPKKQSSWDKLMGKITGKTAGEGGEAAPSLNIQQEDSMQ